MKRVVPFLVLLFLAVSASAAYASGLTPETGAWRGLESSGNEEVGFTLTRTRGTYEATSTRVFVSAVCASDAYGLTTIMAIRDRGIAVKLSRSGQTLKGSRTVKRKVDGGTQTVKVAVTFTSARRAKAVVSSRFRSKSDHCSGRFTVTAKPR